MSEQKNRTRIIAEPGKQEVIITREFDFPRELVFQAYTDPKLYVQWLGPREMKMRLETFEPNSGGCWRYLDIQSDGQEIGFHGVYHDVTAPERIICTFEYEGLSEPGHVCLETIKFEELPGGRCRLTTQDVFQTVADRDGMVQSGMETGILEGNERMDELLEKMRKPA